MRASDSIDALIERRTTAKSNANALEEMWNAGAARHRDVCLAAKDAGAA